MTTNEIEKIVKEFNRIMDNSLFEVGYGPRKEKEILSFLRSSLLAYGEKCREEERESLRQLVREKDMDGLHEDAWKVYKTYMHALTFTNKV